MYSFSAFDLKGSTGPTKELTDEKYASTSVSVEIIGQGIQKWLVPKAGVYKITAKGAAGMSSCTSNVGGNGASLTGIFTLKRNDILYIIVGQMGTNVNNEWGGSGGGASFVVKRGDSLPYEFSLDDCTVTPLIIAAGGGGSGDCNSSPTPKKGTDGQCYANQYANEENLESGASGGAGFSVDSKDGKTKSFLNGAVGGSFFCAAARCGAPAAGTSYGGFGCGGVPFNAGGGGGGYRGGNSLSYGASGHGGLSFNQGLNTTCVAGDNTGNGSVLIELIKRILCLKTCSRYNNRFNLSIIFLLI